MTIQEIATRLVELCRQGGFETAVQDLYADDAVSIEPEATPVFEKETKGLPALLKKLRKFDNMVEEMHGLTVSEPLVANNSFAFILTMDLTMKGRNRETWSELCVYKVKEGKIVAEQFFM